MTALCIVRKLLVRLAGARRRGKAGAVGSDAETEHPFDPPREWS